MIIDHELLSEAALQGVIENFIMRESCLNECADFDLKQQANKIKDQLKSRDLVVTFDADTESINILFKEEANVKNLEC